MENYRYCPVCGTGLETRPVDGIDRKACPSEKCGWVLWDNPVPVVAALVEIDGMILLARNRLWPENIFALITGFIEKNETPEAAAAREIKEELDLDTESLDFIGLYAFMESNQLIAAYHAVCRGEVRTGDEIAAVKKIHPDRLRGWDFGTGPAVRDWLSRRNEAGEHKC